MASSSKRTRKGGGGTFSGEGGSFAARGATVRVAEDSSDNSGSGSKSLEPLGDILGRPTVDSWYRSADVAWTSNFREIRDLQIQRNEMLAVPLVFDFQCSRAVEWADWIDLELADREFCDRLERAGVLCSILIFRCSNMYRDTEALRQLVRRWCPSTHTFFFAHEELTITLEDVENHWLLPILGDQGPVKLELSPEELEIEAALADYIGRKNIALGTHAARFKPWMEHFNREDDPLIRRAAFVAYWLSKCVFGQLYTQLDMLHAEEFAEAFCHIVITTLNSSIVHTFLWEHALEYIKKGRKPYEARNKFASMPEGVVANVGDFQGDVPAVYRWVGSKFYDHSLIPSLDSKNKVCWRPYGVTHRGFSYESVMSSFCDIEAQDYTLIAGDMGSLTYLSATNAGCEIPTINPFLRASAFAYWSGVAPRVIIPSGDRIGVYTTSMSNYWRGLMAAMVEFRNSGRGDISHLLESYTSPLPHPRFLHPPLWLRDHPHVAAPGKVPSSRGRRTASAGTSAVKRKQPERSKKREAPSKDSPARASKKKKTSATKGSKEVLILKTAITSPPLAGEDIPKGVSAPVSKKPVRKTRAGKRTFVPPAFPSAPSSITARVAARKSSRGVVYSEKRSKQRADVSSRVPIEIPDDLDSSSSSSDPSGAAAEEIEGEDAEAGATETVSGGDDFAADIGSINTDAVLSTSSEKNVKAGANTDDDEVSMDELEVAEASSESTPVTSASKPIFAEEAAEEHATVGVVTNSERVVETIPIAVTSSGGTVQGGPSGSGSRVDPSLLDSSPSTRQYVRRARRGSIVSTDSERTTSATVRVPTPPSPLPESGGIALTPITIAAEASAATAIPESEADVTPGSDVPITEEELAQDPVDDIDIANAHDSHDEVLAETEDHAAGAQAADIEVTAPVAAHASPTETGELNGHGLIPICCPLSDEPGRGRIHQSAAVESAIRGQPGLLSATRPATSRTSVLADMEAFFREFDCTSFSSRHAEHFWIFDDVKADFEVFRVPQGGIRFLKALWEKLEDITEVHILEWKAVVQEAIEGGFRFGFILDYLRRLAHGIFSRRVLAELREAEARVAALRDALNVVAPNPWDLASTRKASAESDDGSALHDLLA
uniref:Aminotransferase-like plant mobile domain-containing protein n=1 Tax=Fagus sylvatica TaxID=28930 RepID=A0A2N9IMQ7_FAGSY